MWEEAKIETLCFVKRQSVGCTPRCDSIHLRLESNRVQTRANISKHHQQTDVVIAMGRSLSYARNNMRDLPVVVFEELDWLVVFF